MEVYSDLNKNPNISLALGFFDGVHLGHSCVIKNTVKFAKENNVPSAVLTFANAPKSFFDKSDTKNLISNEHKIKKIENLGVDLLYMLEFDSRIASMSGAEYLQKYVMNYFAPQAITTGFNHTFGNDCQGAALLRQMQKEYNYKYYEIPPITYNDCLISTSAIKREIQNANFEKAKELLGYFFSIEGTVIKGKQLGRTINFPTANLIYPAGISDFPNGAYCGIAIIENQPYKGIFNYGTKPTVANEDKKILEFHIFNFSHDIYGKTIKVVPLKRIRSERKFSSMEELKQQITVDAELADEYFKHF